MNEALIEKFTRLKKTIGNYVSVDSLCLTKLLYVLFSQKNTIIELPLGCRESYLLTVIAQMFELSNKRIQCNPEMRMSDLAGQEIWNNEKNTYENYFGPLFGQIILLNDINFLSSHEQCALLEVLRDKKVQIGRNINDLMSPFSIFATISNQEEMGQFYLTTSLNEAFSVKIKLGFPHENDEINTLLGKNWPIDSIAPLASADDILNLQEELTKIYIDEKLVKNLVQFANTLRPNSKTFNKKFSDVIMIGPSIDSLKDLIDISKTIAYFNEKEYVEYDHLLFMLEDVISHRVKLTYHAALENINSNVLIKEQFNEFLTR